MLLLEPIQTQSDDLSWSKLFTTLCPSREKGTLFLAPPWSGQSLPSLVPEDHAGHWQAKAVTSAANDLGRLRVQTKLACTGSVSSTFSLLVRRGQAATVLSAAKERLY